MDVRPKKHLGQHFLVDQNIARKIVAALATDLNAVVEVGAGMGVLTQYLLPEYGEKLMVIEIDKESIDYLHDNFKGLDDAHLVEGDFLKSNLAVLAAERVGVIGNFPYNISSQIFFHILDYRDCVSEVVGMVQKEVAERISAKPGNKIYGILSVLLQAWYNIEYLFTVNENVFNPPPKVKSAVIRLTRNNKVILGCNEKLFVSIVKQAFNQRRKTMRNSLRSLLNDEIIGNPIFDKRPEQLSVDEFVELAKLIDKP